MRAVSPEEAAHNDEKFTRLCASCKVEPSDLLRRLFKQSLSQHAPFGVGDADEFLLPHPTVPAQATVERSVPTPRYLQRPLRSPSLQTATKPLQVAKYNHLALLTWELEQSDEPSMTATPWRRVARAFHSWVEAAGRQLLRNELLEAWGARHRGCLLWRMKHWRSAALGTRRLLKPAAALRSHALSGALFTWQARREERLERREDAIELAASLSTARAAICVRRLSAAIDAWRVRHTADRSHHARHSRRAHLLWKQRVRVALTAACATWNLRAQASSRANRWLSLADGHHILHTLAKATVRWSTFLYERRRALITERVVRPSPSPPVVRPLAPAPPALALPASRSPSRSPPLRSLQSPPPTDVVTDVVSSYVASSRQPCPLPSWRPSDLSADHLLDQLVVLHETLSTESASFRRRERRTSKM
jgi:hypothetical protein